VYELRIERKTVFGNRVFSYFGLQGEVCCAASRPTF
jgi:hypothetical protein